MLFARRDAHADDLWSEIDCVRDGSEAATDVSASLPSARRAALARMIASKYHIDAFAPHADGERVAVAASALTGNVWDGAVLLLEPA